MEKIDKLITSVQELLERMKTRTRESDKIEFRNSLNISGGIKCSSATKKDYWVTHELNISLTSRWDDDEPNKEQEIEELKGIVAQHCQTHEDWYNKRYNCGSTPVKRDKSTRF